MYLKMNHRDGVSLVAKIGLAAKAKFSLDENKHPSNSVLLCEKAGPHGKAKACD